MNLAIKIKRNYSNKMLKEVLKNIPEVRMRVGWQKTQKEANGMPTAEVAYLNEVGHNITNKSGQVIGHVVARPFLRLACEENQIYWQRIWRTCFRSYLAGKIKSLADCCSLFCSQVIADVRTILDDGKILAPNKESTLRAKKSKGHSQNPLIDYGTLRDTLTKEIIINR